MVAVAQLVRALDCGPKGRRFDPGQPPKIGYTLVYVLLVKIHFY